jgi:hypothetical protein
MSEAPSAHGLPRIRTLGTSFRAAADAGKCDGHEPVLASGRVRVIYFTRLAIGEIWLLVIYAKSVRGSIPASILRAIREAIEHGE